MGVSIKRRIKKSVAFLLGRALQWQQEEELYKIAKRFSKCGENFFIHSPYSISNPKFIKVGNNVQLGSFLKIWSEGGIEIGDDCLIASHVSINSVTHSLESDKFNQVNVARPIKIGNNVWIGSHVVLLPGITIGNNCVIGASTVVTKDIPDNSLVVGIPGRIVKTILR